MFGLEDPVYEFTAMLMHAEHLEARFGVGPHTISVPRIRKAEGIDVSDFVHAVDDEFFKKIVACIRIAVPYTGMIISTRESKKCREELLHLGVSQISGGSKTSVGGYYKPEKEDEDSSQFDVIDNRTLDEVIKWLMELGYLPSFCTACYREGRTGDRFMSICKNLKIHDCCHPNAILTLKEYLEDYAKEETKQLGEEMIKHETQMIDNNEVKSVLLRNLESIKNGERDFRF